MYPVFRDAPIGQILRYLTRNRFFRYPEDSKELQLLEAYTTTNSSRTESGDSVDQTIEKYAPERTPTPREPVQEGDLETGVTNPSTRAQNQPPSVKNNITIITWYSPDDPENPHNWSVLKKLWVSFLLFIYTISVYIGASLYSASMPDIVNIYGVSETVANLGLSLYVLGYGLGPVVFSPLSEIPAIGRNPPYIITYVIFVILCVPTVVVDNVGGLLTLRFLLGFFGSPCLATAGASFGDIWGDLAIPYVIALWGGSATVAPSLGPLVAGFAVQAKDWRWSSWELLWLSGFAMLLILISLPETSSDTILLQRAKRLRALSGRTDLMSASEIKQSKLSAKQIAFDALIKPWEINILDPAMIFTTIYTALIYGIYYSFFDSFPLVYSEMYGFNLGQTGLAFLALLIGLMHALALYCGYIYFVSNPRMLKADAQKTPPEARLWPGLFGAFVFPIGLLIFAWTANPSIHWIVSMVGVGISIIGIFVLFQCLLLYLPFCYPTYAGSLFAANAFARSSLAAGAILFARPMFLRLGVSGGVSLLAGLAILCIGGIFGLYYFGAALRKRSKFAVSED